MTMILRNVIKDKELKLAKDAQVHIHGNISIREHPGKVMIYYCFADEIEAVRYIDDAHKGQKIVPP